MDADATPGGAAGAGGDWAGGRAPSLRFVLKAMVWTLRRDWRVAPHLAAVIGHFLINAASVRWRRVGRGAGGRAVAIALIEHMGDIVAAEPVSRAARARFPQDLLYWISRKPYQAIPARFPAIDRVLRVHCMTEWLLLWSAGVMDVAFDLHISGRPCLKCGIGFAKPGPPGAVTYDTYYDFGNLLAVNCLSAGIPLLDEAPRFDPGPASRSRMAAMALPDRFVVIHCRSNEARRDWTHEGWRLLVAWLTQTAGVDVIEVGSVAAVIRQDGARCRDLCGGLSIPETAALIARAALFVGIDSGPAHLANAVGVPAVIVMGSYESFARYMPYSGGYADGSLADVVRADGPARAVTPEAVIAAAGRRLCLDGG